MSPADDKKTDNDKKDNQNDAESAKTPAPAADTPPEDTAADATAKKPTASKADGAKKKPKSEKAAEETPDTAANTDNTDTPEATESAKASDTATEDTPASDAPASDTKVPAKTTPPFDWELRVRHLVRLLLMIVAGFGVSITVSVLYAITFVQFIYIMVTGEKLTAATHFCSRLSIYVHQLLDFICYRSNDVIFPLAPFPEAPEEKGSVTIEGKAEQVKD